MPETSVIIRAFNEAEYIRDVLEAVENQEYKDFEIILVDSGSTDGTLEIAEEYVDTIEFVSPQNFTFGYSCNVGCEVASGDYCSFLSAHAIPTDNRWLGTMVDRIAEAVTDEELAELEQIHPVGRIGEPNDIANAVVYLASDLASFVTGECLVVDGGRTAVLQDDLYLEDLEQDFNRY